MDTFDEIPAKLRAKISKFGPRMIPGYWTTGEFARLLGITTSAIRNQVAKGKLEPISRVHGQASFFADAEVARYLKRPIVMGRPKKKDESENAGDLV